MTRLLTIDYMLSQEWYEKFDMKPKKKFHPKHLTFLLLGSATLGMVLYHQPIINLNRGDGDNALTINIYAFCSWKSISSSNRFKHYLQCLSSRNQLLLPHPVNRALAQRLVQASQSLQKRNPSLPKIQMKNCLLSSRAPGVPLYLSLPLATSKPKSTSCGHHFYLFVHTISRLQNSPTIV